MGITPVHPPGTTNTDSIIKEIEHLLNERIWKTKKARIEAEARANRNDLIANILTNYYTFIVLAFSIWALILDPLSEDAKIVTIITVIASVGLFGMNLMISLIGFRGKANQYKDSHLKLDSLESDVNNLLRSAGYISPNALISELHSLEKKYNEILSLTDNHSFKDHQKVVIDRKLKEYEIYKKSYYGKVIIKYSLIIMVFILPIFPVFFFMLK